MKDAKNGREAAKKSLSATYGRFLSPAVRPADSSNIAAEGDYADRRKSHPQAAKKIHPASKMNA